MWKRDLLFLGLIGVALVTLGANLLPPAPAQPVTSYDASAYQAADFQEVAASVNASFRQQWAEQSLRPNPPAPDLAVARRLALGLVGTVPSLEEIRQLEQLPPEQRLPWWIDHLLADRRSADYLAERFARSYVGTEAGPFLLFRRRRFVTWLSDELARSRPYDQIVHEVIASRGLWTDQPATNFVSVTAQPDMKNQPDPIRLAGRVTRAFLGLRLDCAQCHNHPYAAWNQSDFQGLAAFFAQTHVGFTGVHDAAGEFEAEDRKTKEKRVVIPRVPFAQDLVPSVGSRRERLAAWVTDPKNPYFARATVNRMWALLLGRPLVDPVDNLETENTPPPALQILADDFAGHGFDLRRLVRVIASTEVFRLDSADPERDPGEAEEKAWASFPLTRLRPEQVVGGLIQSSSITTIDSESHLLVRLARFGNQNEFVQRYGDTGEDDFEGRGGTIPQRLLLMNGRLTSDRIKEAPFNASTRIAWLAPNDARAVETAYLAVLTRRPTPEEADDFERLLAETDLNKAQKVQDLYWALINSTEFSWNH
jgi:hypothetical protein